MIIEGLVLGFLSAYLRGGDLKRLTDLPFKYPWAVIAALLLRIGAVDLASRGIQFFVDYGVWMQLAAFVLLAGVLWLNYPVLWTAAAGVTMNLAVIAANGGAMPISQSALTAAGIAEMEPGISHVLINNSTTLWFLGDVIPLPPPYPLNKIVSVGDLVLLIGVVIYINWVTKDRKKQY